MFSDLFILYLKIYGFLAVIYLWYRYVFIFSEPKCTGNFKSKVTIIIPFYNEYPKLLEGTVKSAYNCLGEKEIIVIDDGSINKAGYNRLLKLKKKIPFELIRYEKNKGKRYAQCVGFKKAKEEIIMTLDSDTVLDKDAIINLVKPFSDEEVGATTGQLGVLNERKNWLAKMQAARYWNAFNFRRKSETAMNAISCCVGPISAYRKEIVLELLDEYLNQNFLGNTCTFGDDRHLTTLILKEKHKVKYVPSAFGYTEVPETWKKLIKQQIRWKKSYLREYSLLLKYVFKHNNKLAFDSTLSIFVMFFSLFARLGLVILIIFNPINFIFAIPFIIFMQSIYSSYTLFYRPRYFIHLVMYGIIDALFIYWLTYLALFTISDTAWGTR